MSRELLKRALEQMEFANWFLDQQREAFRVMDEIRAELAKPDELQDRIANGIRVHARYRNDDGDWIEAFEWMSKPTNATLIIDEGVDLRTQSQESQS